MSVFPAAFRLCLSCTYVARQLRLKVLYKDELDPSTAAFTCTYACALTFKQQLLTARLHFYTRCHLPLAPPPAAGDNTASARTAVSNALDLPLDVRRAGSQSEVF